MHQLFGGIAVAIAAFSFMAIVVNGANRHDVSRKALLGAATLISAINGVVWYWMLVGGYELYGLIMAGLRGLQIW